MMVTKVDEAIEALEKSNASLQPELMDGDKARALLAAYAKAQKLAAYGVAALSGKVNDPASVARMTGTSMGSAKDTVTTGKMLEDSPELDSALSSGDVSMQQAVEIAKAEDSAPGAALELVEVARREPFHVLKHRARQIKLEAERHRDLGRRQYEARAAHSRIDDLGMIDIHLRLEPHVGSPIVAKAEAEAAALRRKAKASGRLEPLEAHLADAYANLLSASSTGRGRRPELVVLVSHEVASRGWKDVRDQEVCKIPGVGPIPPRTAKEIATDAFISAVVCDGKDLRQLKRFTRHIPTEIALALELGEPPDFDGLRCCDCGNRLGNEIDHLEPYGAGGPTSLGNLEPRCRACHKLKTERDRRAGKLRPPWEAARAPKKNHGPGP